MSARILVIDDSPLVRSAMRFALEEAGFEVATAQQGSVGMELLEAFAPEVVISDLEMPDMDGIEVVRRVREQNPVTPVLILTEHGEVPLVVQAMRQGAFGYLRKGLPDEVLVKELRSALNHRALLEKNRALEESNRRYQRELERMVEEKTAELLKLQRMQAQQEKMAALGTLLAGVSHEVNNPLAVITSNADYLLSVVERSPELTAEELREVIEDLGQSAHRIERLMTRLKHMSHPGTPYAQTHCDLRRALDQVEIFCRPQLAGVADLYRQMDFELCEVPIAEDDFVSVVSNLVVNASHAVTPGAGKIGVSVRRTDGGQVELAVSDNGCGIPPELLDRVFDPFFTTKAPGKGTGLGLSLVFQIVSRAGGTVKLESSVGKGTTVLVRLPTVAADGIAA